MVAERYYSQEEVERRVREWESIHYEKDPLQRQVMMTEFLQGAVTILTEARDASLHVVELLESVEKGEGKHKRVHIRELLAMPMLRKNVPEALVTLALVLQL